MADFDIEDPDGRYSPEESGGYALQHTGLDDRDEVEDDDSRWTGIDEDEGELSPVMRQYEARTRAGGSLPNKRGRNVRHTPKRSRKARKARRGAVDPSLKIEIPSLGFTHDVEAIPSFSKRLG